MILRRQRQEASIGTEQSQDESLSPFLDRAQAIKVLLSSRYDFDSISGVAGLSDQSPFGAYSLSGQGHQRVMSDQHQWGDHQAGRASGAVFPVGVAFEECPLASSSAIES
jgi:hypothetical protein